MVRITVIIASIILNFNFLFAQVNIDSEQNENREPEVLSLKNEPKAHDVYLGLSTGINYGGLFALTAEFNIYRSLSIAGGLGLGGWGYKFLGDLRLYKNYPLGIYYVAGIGYATGIPEIELDLETTSGVTQKITMELTTVTNVDLGIGYAWRLGRALRFNLEIGYAVDITPGDAYKVKPGQPELSDLSKKTISLMKPGGLRFGLGFNVGL